MSKEINDMVKIGSHRVLFQSQEDFLLSMKYHFMSIQDLDEEEMMTKQAILSLVIVGS